MNMKTLHQSLIDYEMAQLKAIAACRAVPLETSKGAETVDRLAEALLSPAAVAIALDGLSEAEQEALQLLLDNDGQIEKLRFSRQFGPIRPMGPARLEREKPWQNPVNPAEGLWYRGFIFKTFLVTDQGGLEVFYVPKDLLPMLKILPPVAPPARPSSPAAHNSLAVAPMPVPARLVSGEGRLREHVFSLLVYLQTTPVRLPQGARLAAKDAQALAGCLLPPLLPTFPAAAELDFLLHLGRRAGLLVAARNRLKPDRDPIRAWLQSQPAHQTEMLQKTWRADPTWNDLWHVPGLVPQPTGWENSPLLARAKILNYLAQVDASAPAWLSLDDFVATIKRVDPDFQRPTGDYESWYIQDEQGRSLMGFENWDRVEGALIRHLLTHILPLLGLVDVGLPADTGSPVAFRLTPPGAAFLTGQSADRPPDRPPRFLQVDDHFRAHVSPEASLYDRFQLARFAELDQRDRDRVTYRITRSGVGRALRNGVMPDQIVAFLARATNNQTPLKVVETVRTWGARQGTAKIEPATLLRLKHEGLAAELRQHPTLGPLLGEVIGPQTILIPAGNVREVRRLLTELGYLET